MARPSRLPAAILSVIDTLGRHAWTLDELISDLAHAGVKADFSTVFRAVERLVSAHQLRKLRFDDSPARYEKHGVHHDHVRCTRCAALVPLPCLAHQIDIGSLERSTGYTIDTHDIVLDGTCPSCRTKSLQSKGAHS